MPTGADRSLALSAALAAARRSGAEVSSDGDVFRSRPAGLQSLLTEVVGEVSGRIEGSLLEGYAGVRRAGFTVIAVIVAAALFWELAALLAWWLGAAEHIETRVTWQPLIGALVLLIVVAAGIALLVQAGRTAVDLLNAMTSALPPVTPPAPEPPAERPPAARTASSAGRPRARSRRSPPASPPA